MTKQTLIGKKMAAANWTHEKRKKIQTKKNEKDKTNDERVKKEKKVDEKRTKKKKKTEIHYQIEKTLKRKEIFLPSSYHLFYRIEFPLESLRCP